MFQLKTIVIGILNASVLALGVPNKNDEASKNKWLDHWNCLTLYQKLGAGALVTGAITAGLVGLSWGSKESSTDEDGGKKRLPHRDMPEVATTPLEQFKSDRELFSAVSDVTDYLLDKYRENPKLSSSLKSFVKEHPVEAMAAFKARFPEKFVQPKSAQEVMESLGPQAHYSLVFAWIITEVYNQEERDGRKTLRDIAAEIEKLLQSP